MKPDVIVIWRQGRAHGGHPATQHGSLELPPDVCRLHPQAKEPRHTALDDTLESLLQTVKHVHRKTITSSATGATRNVEGKIGGGSEIEVCI
jgi:hypothetical protein